MRSTNRQARLILRQHIINRYPIYDDLIEDLLACSYNGMTTYQSACRLVEGGCFLVYTDTIIDFLCEVFGKDAKPDLPAEKQWRTYVHLIAREICFFWQKGGYHL